MVGARQADARDLTARARALLPALAGTRALTVPATDPISVAVALIAVRDLAATGPGPGPGPGPTLHIRRRPLPDARMGREDAGQDGTAVIHADGTVTRPAPPGPGSDMVPDTPPAGPDGGATLILETSGTTGEPKRLRHDLDTLLARVHGGDAAGAVWLLTYDVGGFAGLQVLLTALVGGHTLVAAAPRDGAPPDIATLAALAQRHAVSHISATPSFWRGFLMTGAAPPLRAITLGGEAVDQSLLDRLAARFPAARLRHIYASTEAGSLFAVSDGRAGFPAAWLDDGSAPDPRLEPRPGLRIRDGHLWVWARHAARGVAGDWYDTGDRVEQVGDRVLFRGRADGVVNIGGVKVAPEEVEALILAQPGVADAAILAHPSPLTGWILTAELVIMADTPADAVLTTVRAALAALPAAARPRRIAVVPALTLAASGKKRRTTGGETA